MYWKPAVQLQQEEYTFSSFKKPPLRFCLRHVDRQASTVQVTWALLTETRETQKKPAQTPESLPWGQAPLPGVRPHGSCCCSILLPWVHELSRSKLTWMYPNGSVKYQHCCSCICAFCARVHTPCWFCLP